MSDSESQANPETTTTSNVNQVDRRIGATDSAIVATEGARVLVNDLSPEAIAAAVNAQKDTTDISLRANSAVSQAAIDATQEAARVATSGAVTATGRALDTADLSTRAVAAVTQSAIDATQEAARVVASGVVTAQDRALSTVDTTVDRSLQSVDRSTEAVRGVAADSVEAARQTVMANNNLTEKTREGNQDLAKFFLDKSAQTLADQKQGADEAILNNAFKYGAAALLGVAVILGITAAVINRRKAA